MAPGTSRKIAIAVLALLTLGLGAVAIVISLDLLGGGTPTTPTPPPPVSTTSSSQNVVTSTTSSDDPVAGGGVCCGGGYCDANNNGQRDGADWEFGPDNNYQGGDCNQRKSQIAGRAECVGPVVGSDPIACIGDPTNTSTSNSSPNCTPMVSVSSNTVSVPGGCGTYNVFFADRRMTGPDDACFVNQGSTQQRDSGNSGFTLSPTVGRCMCQQVDVIWNGQPYGVKAAGAWDATCEGNTPPPPPPPPTTPPPTPPPPPPATSQSADVAINKESAISSCVADGSSVINYTVTVYNLGGDAVAIDNVIDTLESPISASNISNISNSGVASGNVITWTGPFNINAGGNLVLTYRVTVNAAQKDALGNNIENIVEANFGSDTVSFTHLTNVSCLPNTGLFDEDGRPLLIGLILILLGLLVNRSRYVMNWYNKSDNQPEYVIE